MVEWRDPHDVQRTTVRAPRARLWEVLVDFEHYPEWARDLKEARVVAADSNGRPAQVAFRAAAMGRSTRYILAYDYSSEPEELSWRLVEGDIMRRLDGSYRLNAPRDRSDETEVSYRLLVELVVPLPAFVKRRAEGKIVHTALRELKAHVEAGASDLRPPS